LLEVLVALVVLGLLILGLTSGIRFGLFAFDQQSLVTAHRADLDAAYRTLRHLIEHAAPGSEWEPLDFVGSAHSAIFTGVIPVPGTGPISARADVELAVDAGHQLLLVRTPHLHAIRIGPGPAAVKLRFFKVSHGSSSPICQRKAGDGRRFGTMRCRPDLFVSELFSVPSAPGWPDLLAADDRPTVTPRHWATGRGSFSVARQQHDRGGGRC
jgi:hypothetical protein